MTDDYYPIPGHTRECPSAERPDIVNELRAEVRGIKFRPAKKKPAGRAPHDPVALHQMFTVCTGNRWLELGERKPAQRQLFGPFWHQRELCILFGASNTGKSILAMQIADALSRGRSSAPLSPRLKPRRVLYIDFELSTAQLSRRYGQPARPCNFSETFFRAEFNHDPQLCPDADQYDDFLFGAIEYKIQLVKPGVLIIDNLSCLSANITSGAVALRVLKNLKQLQTRYNLSVLVLAHTPKRSGKPRPLSADDLYGSKLLINFADSAFAIGASQKQRGWCYLKQIKQRNTEQVYHDGNVCLCHIVNNKGLLRFKFKGYGTEHEQLRGGDAYRNRLGEKAGALALEGYSQREIARKLRISLGLVNKLIREANPALENDVGQPKPVPSSGEIRVMPPVKLSMPADKPPLNAIREGPFRQTAAFSVLSPVNGS